MSDGPRRIDRIEGRAVPLRGADIDTDRIMPARFLKAVSFEGLGAHVFEDDRQALAGGATPHPFSDPRYDGATILLVSRNFGCGSSREHAPQGLMRWGIQGLVGEAFSEIFFGNSVALGLPCVTIGADDVERLMSLVEERPETGLTIDVEALTVKADGQTISAEMPRAAQDAFLTGAWDATGLLLADAEEVEAVARRLPYIAGF